MTRATPVLGDASSPLSLPARAALGEPRRSLVWMTLALGGYVAAVVVVRQPLRRRTPRRSLAWARASGAPMSARSACAAGWR